MKKMLFTLLLLFPMFVVADTFDNITLKWTEQEIFEVYEGIHITENNVVFQYEDELFYYTRNGKYGDSYVNGYIREVNLLDNYLYVCMSDKFVKLDESLEELEVLDFEGYLEEAIFLDDTIIVVSDISESNNYKMFIYELDYDLNVLRSDSVKGVSSFNFTEDDGNYYIRDYRNNEYIVNDEFEIIPVNTLSDGSYVVYNDNYVYKYNKNDELIKTFDFNNIRNAYGYKYIIVDDNVYVTNYISEKVSSTNNDYYITIYLYKLDKDLNLVMSKTPFGKSDAYRMYYNTNYSYAFNLWNDKLYISGGSAFSNSYYHVDNELTLTKVNYSDVYPGYDYDYVPDDEDYIYDSLYDIKPDDYYFDFSYDKDNDGNFIVGVTWRYNSYEYDEQDVANELIYLDSEYNIVKRVKIQDYEFIDDSYFPDGYEEVDCFSKRFDTLVKYYKDYVIVAAGGANESVIQVYDKSGKLVVDFTDDIDDLTNFPTFVEVKDNSLIIVMSYGFNIVCIPESPRGSAKFSGSDFDYKEVEVSQILYYDLPYAITTKVEGKGTIKVSKNSEFSGNEIVFEVTPQDGYKLDKVIVTTVSGEKIVFDDYKFTMPSADVTIEALFVVDNPNTLDIALFGIYVLTIISALVVMKYRKKLQWLK